MMSDEAIRRKINEVLVEEFELEPDVIRPEATLYDDLGLDSLDSVDMVVALERAFDTKLKDEESIRKVRTVGDLYDLITGLKREKAAGE